MPIAGGKSTRIGFLGKVLDWGETTARCCAPEDSGRVGTEFRQAGWEWFRGGFTSVVAIDPRFWSYLPLIILTTAIVIGVPVAHRLWREVHEEEEPARPSDLLTDFEQAYDEGKMNEAEFRRIREKLIGLPGKATEKIRPGPHQDEPGRSPAASPDQAASDESGPGPAVPGPGVG